MRVQVSLVASLLEQKQGVVHIPEAADQAGIPFHTAQAAAQSIGVSIKKEGFSGGWTWRLPKAQAEPRR